MLERKAIKYFDIWLVLFVVALFGVGIITLGSALRIDIIEKDDFRYVLYIKQIVGFCIGLMIMLFIAFFNYDLMKRMFIFFYVVNLGLLAVVLVIGTGDNVSRWISIMGVQFQPSEFAKIFTILFFAALFEKYIKNLNRLPFLIISGVLVLIPVALIRAQPDLSTSIVVLFLFVTALFVAGLDRKYILIATLIAVPLIAFIFFDAFQESPIFLQEYQANRIKAMIDLEAYATGEGYQTLKSIETLGSGKLHGHGLYNGLAHPYLPESHNDFILAVLGDEFGFIGCVGTICLYILIMIRCTWNAMHAPDLYGKIICSSVAALICFQAFVNMGVATAILPNTGLPLPFFSYGMSSLWSSMIGVGLVLNVGMMRKLTYSRR